MSLLIDALKRAENAKRGQTEPQLAPADREAGAEGKPSEWTLAESASDEIVNAPTPVPPEAPSRTEPKFFQTVNEPRAIVTPASAATRTTAGSSKLESERVIKEREAAQTLFQAKRPAPRSRAGMLLVGGLAALLLAAGGFYVWYSFEFPPSPPFQPTQARNSPPPAPPVSPSSVSEVKAPAVAEPESKSLPETPQKTQSSKPAKISPAATVALGPAGMGAAPPTAKRPRRVASPVAEDDADVASAAELSTEETVRREVEQAQQPRGAKPRRQTKSNRGISVSQAGHGSSDFDPDLAIAYNALLSGQRADAKRLYMQVAERDPFNVDALLGLATIAANQGDLTGAERHYQRALELEPQQPAALAGLASIRQPGGPSESQIKFELARNPDSAQLHFALGNQYANQNRWDEAQQAYFDAFNLDSGSPDYAYNLAVSLDQLGQSKQASTYYRKALDLARNKSARFRPADVSSRLSELAAAR